MRGTAESIRPPSDGGELGRSRDTEFYCLCDLLTSEKRAISRPGAHVLLSRRLADTQAFGVPGDRGCLWLRLWGALGTGRFNIGVVRQEDVPGWMVVDLADSRLESAVATLHLEKLWIRDVTVTTGLVDTYTIPGLMRLVASGRLDPTIFGTHRFALGP